MSITFKGTVSITYLSGETETVPVVCANGRVMCADAFYGLPARDAHDMQRVIEACIVVGCSFGMVQDSDGNEYEWAHKA